MATAYLDSSFFLSMVLGQTDPSGLRIIFAQYDLIHPTRSLGVEIRQALDEAYLRGADLWHVACALFVATDSQAEIAFLSRDRSQRRVANDLGFETP